MSKKLTVVISILVLFVIFLGATFYFVADKIRPDELKKLLIDTIETTLPGSQLKIRKIDYSLGTSINIHVHGIDLKDKEKKQLLEVEKIAVQVPVVAILTDGGSIKISSKSPKLFVNGELENTNWHGVLPKTNDNKSQDKQAQKTEFEIPKFVEKSKINLQLKNVIFDIDIQEKLKTLVKVSKLNLKNINLKKRTAFEFISKLSYSLDPQRELKTNITIIGEIHLAKLLSQKTIDLNSTVKISKTKMTGLNYKIPNLSSKFVVKGLLDKLNIGYEFAVQDLINSMGKVFINKEKIDLELKGFSLQLKNLLKNYGKELPKDLLKRVDLKNSNLAVSGNVGIERMNNTISPNLKIESSKQMNLNMAEVGSLGFKFSGSLIREKLKLALNGNVLKGSFLGQVNTDFDINNIDFSDISKLPLINIKLEASNIVVGKKLAQSFLKSDKKAKTTQVVAPTPNILITLPKSNIELKGINLKLAEEEHFFRAKIKSERNKVTIEKFNLGKGKGLLNAKSTVDVFGTKNMKGKFDLQLKRMDLNGVNIFLPKYIQDVKGIFSGKVTGSFAHKKEFHFNSKINIKGTRGEIKNLNIAKFVGPMLSEIKLLKGKVPKKQNISNKFDEIQFQGDLNQGKAKVKKLMIIGHNKESKAKATGTLAFSDKKNSKLKGKVYIKQIEKEMKKNFGVKDIPFLMQGKGFVIKPDLGYTSKYLVGKGVKKELKKQKKKFKKDAEELLKKKAEKLFKGIKL